MADLTYIQGRMEVSIAGQDSTGDQVNYVTADTNGNMAVKDYADGTPGSAVPSVATQIAGSDGTDLRTIATDASGHPEVVGNIASGSADSGNPVKIGAVYNSTLPTPASGQRVDAQADLNGRRLVASAPLDGYKATYSTSILGLASATTATDIFTITGSATKTVRVLKLEIAASQTTASPQNVVLIKRSAANSGGTSTTPTIVPHDSNNAVATAVVNAYTANPTSLGASVGNVRVGRLFIDAVGGNSAPTEIIWDFGIRPSQAIVLRGTTNVLAVNLNSTTIAGGVFDISIEWTEE